MNINLQLSERQRIEQEYHDAKYNGNLIQTDYNFREEIYYRFFWEQIGDVSGLKILDFGCGNGWVSIQLAKKGAKKVYGIDISGELIKKGNMWVENEGFSSKIDLKKMPGEKLVFPGEFFDLILGSAILHHTEIELALKSIFRVLKPEGRGIFIEPLNQNIFLRIWRLLTPWRRSPTEKALTNKDLNLIQSIFPNSKLNYFLFTSIFSEGLTLLFPKCKTLIYFNILLEKIDNRLLKALPFWGKYCAVVVLELKK